MKTVFYSSSFFLDEVIDLVFVTSLAEMPRKRKRAGSFCTPTASGRLSAEACAIPPVDVVIDGSQGEGGGQMVRMSLALSSILDRSVRIHKIRNGRSQPGLQAQHTAGANLVARVAQADIHGALVRSTSLTMSMPAVQRRDIGDGCYECVINTAGATSLVLQAVLPAALRFLPDRSAGSEKGLYECPTLRITGGTTALFAPLSDYVECVLIPNLRLFGIGLDYRVEKHGFFPRGGGLCAVRLDKSRCSTSNQPSETSVPPQTLVACDVTRRGNITSIEGVVLISGPQYEHLDLGEHMRRKAVRVLRSFTESEEGYPSVTDSDIVVRVLSGREMTGKNVSMTLYAKTEAHTVIGSSAIWSERDAVRIADEIGCRSKAMSSDELWQHTAAHVGTTVAKKLCTTLQTGAVIDAHMADQLCAFMAMATGTSRLLVPEPTQHVLSVVDVAQQFGLVVNLEEVAGSSNRILTCDGVGVRLAGSGATAQHNEDA